MDSYIRIIAGALVATILGLTVSKQGKEITLLLAIGVCSMVLIGAISYLQPVVTFMQELQLLGNLDGKLMGIMLKSVGIGLIAEIAALICNDSGNVALGKTIQTLACCVLLWLALPLFQALISLLQKILGEL